MSDGSPESAHTDTPDESDAASGVGHTASADPTDRDLASGFLSIFNARLLVSTIGVLSLPVVVRVLGADGYGDYAFLMSAFSMLMILVSSPVTEGLQKFVAEERDLPDWREHVVGFYLRFGLLLAAVGGLALAALAWTGVIGRLFGDRFGLYFLLLAALVVAAQLRAFTRRSLMGLGLERYSETLVVSAKVLWLAVGLGLATVGLGVTGFLVAKVVAAGTVAVVGFAVLTREVSLPRTLSARPESFPAREVLSFNGLNVVLVLLLMSHYHVDVLMLRTMAGSEATGYYKAALALAQYMWLVPIALQTLLLHSTSALWSRDERERVGDLASTVTRYVFLLTALLAFGVYALADRFVPLYFGSDFTVVVAPLVFLLPGAMGFAMARPLYGINQARGRLLPVIFATGAAAVPNVALNYLLIPRYGMVGAAIATSTGYGAMFVCHVACARFLGYDPLDGVRPVRSLAAAVVGGALVLGVEAPIGSDLVALAVVPVAGFLGFTATALALGAVDGEELLAVVDALPVPLPTRVRALVSRS